MGTTKWVENETDYTSSAGLHGCPVGWSTREDVHVGAEPGEKVGGGFVSGTPMRAGQACGNEQRNVYVRSVVDGAEGAVAGAGAEYAGCRFAAADMEEREGPSTWGECLRFAADTGKSYFGLTDASRCFAANAMGAEDATQTVTRTVVWSSGTTGNNMARVNAGGQLEIVGSDGATQRVFGAADGRCGDGRLRVESATYGGNCGNVPIGNVTPTVQGWIEGTKASIPISNGTLGDPAPSCVKAFDIAFTCGNTKMTRNVAPAEGQTLLLDCATELTGCAFSMEVGDAGLYLPGGPDGAGQWVARISKNASDAEAPARYAGAAATLRTGEWLLPGAWLLSPSRKTVLEMSASGALELCVFAAATGCVRDPSDGAMHGRTQSDTQTIAWYASPARGDPALLGKLAYVDADLQRHEYPDEMIALTDTYDLAEGYDVADQTLSSSAQPTMAACQDACSADDACGGYVYQTAAAMCWLKKRPLQQSARQPAQGVTLGVRRPVPAPQSGWPSSSSSSSNALPTPISASQFAAYPLSDPVGPGFAFVAPRVSPADQQHIRDATRAIDDASVQLVDQIDRLDHPSRKRKEGFLGTDEIKRIRQDTELQKQSNLAFLVLSASSLGIIALLTPLLI